MKEPEIDGIIQNADMHAFANQQVNQGTQAEAARYYLEEQERTIAEAQLEVESILMEVYHLLRQDTLKPKEDGTFEWVPTSDPTKRVLTDAGVEKIMQVMRIYVNKNVLLSNFTEEQIRRRMLNFCLALNSNLFMKYEVYFRQPTLEEVKNILKERLERKKQLKKFAAEIAGLDIDENEIEKEVLREIEGRIEYELEKIKQEIRRRNLREYELIFRELEQIVEATHYRAYKGEERGSLRRHMNVAEIIGNYSNNEENYQKIGKIFPWNKK